MLPVESRNEYCTLRIVIDPPLSSEHGGRVMDAMRGMSIFLVQYGISHLNTDRFVEFIADLCSVTYTQVGNINMRRAS